MSREMKDSGVEWIGEIPEDWEIIRAKNVFSYHKDIVGEKENEYERLSLTLNGVLKRKRNDSKGLQSESLSTYQILNKDELVFKMIDLENISTSRVGYSKYTGLVSPVYIIFNNSDYARFGYYYFYNMWQRAIFNQLGNNGVRSALNASDMLNLPFPKISKKEANKIANFLDEKVGEIDRLIDNAKKSIEEYKKYKQSVITEAVTKGLDPNVEMKDSGIEWIGEIPKDSKVSKVLYILSMPITDGPHTTPKLYDIGIPFVSAEAISFGNGQIDFNHIRGFISNEFYEECCKKYVPQKDDIYMIKSGATTGKVSIVNTDKIFTIWSPLAVFRADKERILPMFLFYSLQADYFQKQIELGWTYGTQQNIGMRTLENLKICYSSLYKQQKIINYLDLKCAEIENLISKKQQLISALESYKKSLIYEYVTGKKEVL